MTKEEITKEIRQRAEILGWMHESDIRTYREVAKAISRYAENPEDFLKKMRHPDKKKKKDKHEDKKEDKKKEEKKPIEEGLDSFETASGDQEELPEVPAIQLEEKQEKDQQESDVDLDVKVDAFKDIETIDEKTAVLLYDNGFTSIEDLKNATAKDLAKIKGIKKRIAKKIIKELSDSSNEELSQVSDDGGEMGAAK